MVKPKLTKEERKANRKVFFEGSKVDVWTPSDIDRRAIAMLSGLKNKDMRWTV